jgi:DNA (cytosine-5)-methyltransferase 1
MGKCGLRMASLFSGCGGLDMGFAMNGSFELIMANDILPASAMSYSRNLGHRVVQVGKERGADWTKSVFLLGDVSDIDFSESTK